MGREQFLDTQKRNDAVYQADDQDREEFLLRFSLLLKETSTDCFAWALLNSHFHLLVQPQFVKLAHFMRRLLTGYAVVFNLRHGRAGHLFHC